MRKILPVCLLCLALLAPAALADSEPATLALKAVTYDVEWTYYDGYVAEVGIRETPNEDDVALVWALAYDPNPDITDTEMNDAAKNADRVIGSYCEVDLRDPANPEAPGVSSGGGSGFDGRGLSSKFFALLPEGNSPAVVDAWVSVGVRTKAEPNEYDEWETFILPLAKTDAPVLNVSPGLDLGPTRVEQVLVCRTPATLVLRVLHTPVGPDDPSPFTVTAEKGEKLPHSSTDYAMEPDGTLAHTVSSFTLKPEAPTPSALRLSYHGAASDLLVDLETGTVTMEAK